MRDLLKLMGKGMTAIFLAEGDLGGGGGDPAGDPNSSPSSEAGTPAGTPASQPSTGDQPFVFFGADGKLTENFREGLPEDLRGDPTLDTFTDFPGAVKMLVSGQKMIGKDKIVKPGEHSSDEEWNNLYDALGRPASEGDYQFEVDETLKEYYPAERMDVANKALHEAGLNQTQYAKVMEVHKAFLQQDMEQMQNEQKTQIADAETLLHKMQGPDLDKRLHMANIVIEQHANPDHKEKILEALNNPIAKPYLLDILANIGDKMVEHNVTPPPAGGTGLTPQTAQAKMQELQSTPGYLNGQLKKENPAAYNRITQEAAELARIASAV